MGRWIFSARIMAASAAVLSVALTLRLATPGVADFLAAGVPQIYISVASWLTPPYLYLIINGIIISIAATSRHQKTVVADGQLRAFSEQVDFHVEDADLRADVLDPRTGGDENMNLSMKTGLEEEFVISSSSWSPRRRESKDPLEKSTGNGLVGDKPLVSTRLSHRRSIKTSPEGSNGIPNFISLFYFVCLFPPSLPVFFQFIKI